MIELSSIKKYGAVVAVFIVFQIILFQFSVYFLVFSEVGEGFFNFVDVVSKIATSATLMWGIYIFAHADAEKKVDVEREQIKSLSFKLIEYVSAADFSVNKITLNVVLSYLELIANPKFEQNKNLPEKKLIFDILCYIFSEITLKQVLGIESEKNFNSVCKSIGDVYGNAERLKEFDSIFWSNLTSDGAPSRYVDMNIPCGKIQNNQIVEVMSFVLKENKNDLIKVFSEKPDSWKSVHHDFPVLVGIFYAYTKGNVYINKENNNEISCSLSPCQHPPNELTTIAARR